MNITEAFVLKDDVVLIPCVDLSEDVRRRISFDEGDFTLSRRHGRALVQVIDADTAALLSLFREARTIVDAVIENSRATDRDPHARLEELLPHLGKFLENRVLVPAGSDEEKEIRPRFEVGSIVAGWEIVRCVNLIEDTEIYQLRRGGDVAALKIARLTTPDLHAQFENEIAILHHLDGSGVAPRLLDSGVHDDRAYFIEEWVSGTIPTVLASQRRHDRVALIDLCASIAAAYAALHARGVLHADVHPANVLAGDRVTLIDFGYSRFADQPPRIARGGLYYFFEPEYIADPDLPASPAGEQYAVAALLYHLIAGEHYLDFRYDRQEMSRQVEVDPPLPFAARGIPPWPEVEAILVRALEKDPAKRHASLEEMASLLASARDNAMRESLAAPIDAEANAFLETTLRSFMRGGEMFRDRYPDAPTASINYGAAGAAIGLLRIAETRGDPELLALADIWRSRAVALIGTEGAYANAEMELPAEVIGEVTPYHTEAGIHAVAAVIAASMGDSVSHRRAIDAFIRASRRPCTELDLTLGRSGTLLAAAMLLANVEDLPALRAFGTETMNAIWNELDARPAIVSLPDDTSLGMAHGWTGYFYAALRWCAASGDPLPARLVERLHEFAALKTTTARGAFWRPLLGDPVDAAMPGWCNGSAGQVFLFTLAHRMLGEGEWLRLAELCAWDSWDQPRGVATLCCGSAGRAYALVNLYKHTGETAWLGRAQQLANHAVEVAVPTSQRKNALWKGELGVAVLVSDLSSPAQARMPFFE